DDDEGASHTSDPCIRPQRMPAAGAARLSGHGWASPHADEVGGVPRGEIVDRISASEGTMPDLWTIILGSALVSAVVSGAVTFAIAWLSHQREREAKDMEMAL